MYVTLETEQMADKKKSKAVWSGPSLDALSEFEQEFCHLGKRNELRKAAIASGVDTPSGQMGLLVNEAHGFFKSRFKNEGWHIPKRDLAAEINEKSTHLSTFLKGKQHSKAWIPRAREAFSYLISRTKQDPAGLPECEEQKTAHRIYRFFFRGESLSPTFFSGPRLGSPHAWSYYELAAQIAWLARYRQRNPEQACEFAFVSGGQRFFSDVATNDTSLAAQDCVVAGVRVGFYFPSNKDSAARSAAEFGETVSKTVLLRSITTLNDTVSFLTPNTSYLLLSVPGRSQLWFLPPRSEGDESEIDGFPVAMQWPKVQVAALTSWLEAVEQTFLDTNQTTEKKSGSRQAKR